jgi:hypothetical protein
MWQWFLLNLGLHYMPAHADESLHIVDTAHVFAFHKSTLFAELIRTLYGC